MWAENILLFLFLSSPSPSPLIPIPIGTGADNKVLWSTTPPHSRLLIPPYNSNCSFSPTTAYYLALQGFHKTIPSHKLPSYIYPALKVYSQIFLELEET